MMMPASGSPTVSRCPSSCSREGRKMVEAAHVGQIVVSGRGRGDGLVVACGTGSVTCRHSATIARVAMIRAATDRAVLIQVNLPARWAKLHVERLGFHALREPVLPKGPTQGGQARMAQCRHVAVRRLEATSGCWLAVSGQRLASVCHFRFRVSVADRFRPRCPLASTALRNRVFR